MFVSINLHKGVNKKVIICRDLVTLTSHDPKNPHSRQKIFNFFVPHIKDYQHAKKQSGISMGFENICILLNRCA